MDSRYEKIKNFIDTKYHTDFANAFFESLAESSLFSYGKSCVFNYLECVLYAIDQYSSLSSDDVVDILHEVYSLLYPRD